MSLLTFVNGVGMGQIIVQQKIRSFALRQGKQRTLICNLVPRVFRFPTRRKALGTRLAHLVLIKSFDTKFLSFISPLTRH